MSGATGTYLGRAYWATTFALFGVALGLLTFYTPTEATMGPIQKVFYLHLPTAIATFLACFVCFIAAVGYLAGRNPAWDDLGAASARVSVQLCTVVLLTGMIWGRSAWGMWWTWSPRLTFSLVLWLLYVVYLMVRMSIESPERRALVCAVYAIIAFLDVPLVYLSVRLMPDIHPGSIELAPAMKLTLLAWFVPVFMLTGGMIFAKCRLNWADRLAAARRAAEAGVEQTATTGPIRWTAPRVGAAGERSAAS
jgi:heme exporter protein C